MVLIEKQNASLMGLGFLLFVFVILLSIIGEARLDVYTSALTIAYFANSIVFKVKRRTYDFLGVTLLIVFGVSIASIVV